jgi:hypothetical protein
MRKSAHFFIFGSELEWRTGAYVERQQGSNFVARNKWFLFSGLAVREKLGVFDIEKGCSEARGWNGGRQFKRYANQAIGVPGKRPRIGCSWCVNTWRGSGRLVFQLRFEAGISLTTLSGYGINPMWRWMGFITGVVGSWMDFSFGREVIL